MNGTQLMFDLPPRQVEHYAYRLETKRIAEPDFPYPSQPLTCALEVHNFATPLFEDDIERFVACFLNAQNVLIGIHIITGTNNQAVVYPRDIIKKALLVSADALILFHNHPSGSVKPSDADINLTKKIFNLAEEFDIRTHDHIVVARDKFFSFQENGVSPWS